MKFNFFSKYSKFNVNSKNVIKKPKNVFDFLDICICIGNGTLSVLVWEIFVIDSQRVNKQSWNLRSDWK